MSPFKGFVCTLWALCTAGVTSGTSSQWLQTLTWGQEVPLQWGGVLGGSLLPGSPPSTAVCAADRNRRLIN